MRRTISGCLMLAAVLALTSTEAWSCREIVPIGKSPYTAESYPLPLSLRRNLVYLVKTEMRRRGEYNDEGDKLSGVFYDRFKEAVARAQQNLGEEPTGCLTWSVVREYDPAQRIPPK